MSRTIHFLEKPRALASQVAEILLAGLKGRPTDLSDTQVWVPTAGAERRIRFALARLAAEKQTGVLPPVFTQPMRALLPETPPFAVAARAGREGAWAQALHETRHEAIDALLPREDVAGTERARLGIGGLLCDLCDLLAEAGLDPADASLAEICENDSARWEQLRALYGSYLRVLKDARLSDPNALRLEQLRAPSIPRGIKRVVVACIPDLPVAAEKFAEALAGLGVRVEVLVWKPGAMGGGFDAWGRPLREEWNECPLAIDPAQIAMARETADEAGATMDFLAAAETPGDYALVLADQTLEPVFSAEILRRGGRPFLPEGRRLSGMEPAVIAVEWESWLAGRDLRTLRALLQRPHFNGWLGGLAKLAPSRLLAACDHLICELLAETLDQARAAIAHDGTTDAAKLVTALDSVGGMTFAEVLRRAWAGGADEAGAARRVLELWQEISASPVFKNRPEGRSIAFTRALRAEAVFESSSSGAVELSGWLEAPWSDAGRLAVCGCVEGRLPGSVNEHAFLPDSRRKALGLPDNEARLARDSYLLNCLLNVHGGNLRLSFSKFGADGSPSMPSRLLLRCEENELPARVLDVFKKAGGARTRPVATNGWRWSLPETLRREPPQKISPTGFKEYLACPLRFYLGRVLHLDQPDTDAREMDAARFGTLVHLALEAFGKDAPHEGDAAKIEALVLGHLDAAARGMFGPLPAPAVRVQIEAAKVRLRAFARVQAAEFAEGWRILDVEKKIDADDPLAPRIGPLALSAKIDRIEEHPEHGIRILDYKTYATKKTPAKTHLGGAAANGFLDEARVTVDGREKCWVDLQLPLYRLIAEGLHPGRQVRTAYFVLPADPDASEVISFDLDGELLASARMCAEAVASRVHRGVFWPPQAHTAPWEDPFAPFFINGAPGECFDAETIEFLKGDEKTGLQQR